MYVYLFIGPYPILCFVLRVVSWHIVSNITIVRMLIATMMTIIIVFMKYGNTDSHSNSHQHVITDYPTNYHVIYSLIIFISFIIFIIFIIIIILILITIPILILILILILVVVIIVVIS